MFEFCDEMINKMVHQDTYCKGTFSEWLEKLTYLMTKTLQCLSAHESHSNEAQGPIKITTQVPESCS